jgi:hypothetical protein
MRVIDRHNPSHTAIFLLRVVVLFFFLFFVV